MRKLVLLLVAGLAVGALLGHLMMSVPGYWLIRVGDTSVQTSFWFGLIILLAAFIVVHFALRLLTGIIRPVGRFRTWNGRARNRRAMKRTVRGLVALTEGRWKKLKKPWFTPPTTPAPRWLTIFQPRWPLIIRVITKNPRST